MAQSSDIEFAKLCVILKLVSREDIYKAIRETALLQELEINKRLPHVLYERKYLTIEEIQAILWALYKSNKIRRYPPRIVYEFTPEDDKEFLQKVLSFADKVWEFLDKIDPKEIKDKKREIKEKFKKESTLFPYDLLIYALNIKRMLKDKGFDRPLLSILNSKGYFREEKYRKLVPYLEKRKKILSAPYFIKDKKFIKKCEIILVKKAIEREYKLSDDIFNNLLEIWEKIENEIKINLNLGEILYYLNKIPKDVILKNTITLKKICSIDHVPRLHLFGLSEKDRNFVKEEISKLDNYKDKYKEAVNISSQLQKIGLNIHPAEIMIIKGYITKEDIIKYKKEIKIQGLQEVKLDEKEYERQKKEIEKRYIETLKRIKERKKNFIKKEKEENIPFLNQLEKDISNYYVKERVNVRKNPFVEPQETIKELYETQLIPFEDVVFTPTQETNLKKQAIKSKSTKDLVLTPKVKLIDATEYLSLEDKEDSKVTSKKSEIEEIGETAYISIDATPEEIKEIVEEGKEKASNPRKTQLMLFSLFIVAAGIAIVEPKFTELFGETKYLPYYTGGSMLVVFLPFLFLGNWFGKLNDEGKAHLLFRWGFVIYGLSLVPLALFSNFLFHCIVRFIQGIGLAAIFTAAEYCIGRWYSPQERGKMTGLAMMIFTIGFCLGFLLTGIFEGSKEAYGISELVMASLFWTIISLISVYFVNKIRINKYIDEDILEEGEEKVKIPKEPLIAAALYGVTEMAFFAVFFPFISEKAPFGANTEDLILMLTLGVLLFTYPLGWLGDRYNTKPLLVVLSLVSIACFCALPFINNPDLAKFIFFIIGVVIGGLCPLGFAWLLSEVESDKDFGAAAGAFSEYEGAGSMLGCILSAIIFKFFGAYGFFLFLSLIFVGYFYLLITAQKRETKIKESGEEEPSLGGLLKLLEPK